jgi:hypothetical protein
LEWHRWRERVSIFDAKLGILRDAVRLYLAHPKFCLPSTA